MMGDCIFLWMYGTLELRMCDESHYFASYFNTAIDVYQSQCKSM